MATTETTTTSDTSTVVAIRPPSKYNVILYNDNVTTVEFVILVLMSIFHKSFEDASALTINIHDTGKGVAGIFSHEIASQKREETVIAARTNGFPLRCEIEEA